MLRCLKPGCPGLCGTRTRPSCTERRLYYVVLLFLTAAFVVSLGMGMKWVNESGGDSGGSPEAAPVAGAQTFELVSQAANDGGKRVFGHPDRKPAFLADAPVQVPQQG